MTIFLLLAFLAGFLVVFAVNMLLADLFTARSQQIRLRLEQELIAEKRGRAKGSMDHKELYELAAKESLDLGSRLTLHERLDRFVDQTGARVNTQRVVLFVLIGASLAAVMVSLFTGPVVGILAAPLGAALPLSYLWILRVRRLKKLKSQLPDVFDLMSRMLRAGRTISQAFQSVADEFPRPAAEEFGYAFEQQNLGLSPEAALRELARRTGLLEVKIFVLAVMVHQQTGGNLAELLEKLATIVRERFRIAGMIRSLTAEGRLQAVILLCLPPFLLLLITLVNRPYAAVLFDYPMLLAGMAGFMLFGALWMQRIVNFDF